LTGTIGDAIVLPADPTYPGFLFAGWYTDSACTTPFTETTYNNNMMVYAKWTLDPAQSLPVMSFNVKTNNSNKDLVIDIILENNPYVFGVQEADSIWMSTLKNKLGSIYSCVGVERGGGIFNSGSEHSAIFYRTDMFTLIEGGTKWLSQTPDVASKYSDGTNTANYNRIMTYVVLERKSDGAQFIYVNTHLDNNGDNDGTAAENVRKGQVEILLQQVQVLYNKYGNLPTVVTGDFNTQPNTVSYKAMLEGGFVDSSKVAVEADDKRTLNGNSDSGNVIFDYVFVSSDWADAVETYKVCEEKRNGTWISDHNAIISTIVFPLTK
ncbi:MAG: endonuclease/exonuclease/phosphatase family protein, partial [Clostridia bacterium]|nr:endonuclease/exonuclease/phosphatase family protein [Clostridia bacterium]